MWTECCIAVIMGSVAAFRALFVQDHSRIAEEQHKSPSYLMHQRLLRKWKRSQESSLEDGEREGLPQVPSATFTGLRTFIRRHDRSAGATTMMRSEFDNFDEPLATGDKRGNQIYSSMEWDVRSHRIGGD